LIYGLGAVANIGVAPSAAYYLLLLSNGTLQLFAPEMLDRAFDNMLLHLLHGEAFTRDGKTYAYFGVFPALLRLIAMPFTDIAQAELARLSCLTAVVIFVALQLGMLLIVQHSLPAGSRRPELLAVMLAATRLSGPQLTFSAHLGSITSRSFGRRPWPARSTWSSCGRRSAPEGFRAAISCF